LNKLPSGWQGTSILNPHLQVAQVGYAEPEQRHLSLHIQAYLHASRCGRERLRCRRNAYKALAYKSSVLEGG